MFQNALEYCRMEIKYSRTFKNFCWMFYNWQFWNMKLVSNAVELIFNVSENFRIWFFYLYQSQFSRISVMNFTSNLPRYNPAISLTLRCIFRELCFSSSSSISLHLVIYPRTFCFPYLPFVFRRTLRQTEMFPLVKNGVHYPFPFSFRSDKHFLRLH